MSGLLRRFTPRNDEGVVIASRRSRERSVAGSNPVKCSDTKNFSEIINFNNNYYGRLKNLNA